MYAAHFATGLALKSVHPKAPAPAVLVGVFLPDFFWVVFARAGIEPSGSKMFFDDWSHSLLMVMVYATLYASCLLRRGWYVMCVMWVAVLSHFCLDVLIHPKYIALYPHSNVHLGWIASGGIYELGHWTVEFAIVCALSAVYLLSAKRHGHSSNLIAASLILVFGLQMLGLP